MHPASTVRQATSVAFKYLGKVDLFLMIINILYNIVITCIWQNGECSPNAEWSEILRDGWSGLSTARWNQVRTAQSLYAHQTVLFSWSFACLCIDSRPWKSAQTWLVLSGLQVKMVFCCLWTSHAGFGMLIVGTVTCIFNWFIWLYFD